MPNLPATGGAPRRALGRLRSESAGFWHCSRGRRSQREVLARFVVVTEGSSTVKFGCELIVNAVGHIREDAYRLT
jgi:hypothetical protein